MNKAPGLHPYSESALHRVFWAALAIYVAILPLGHTAALRSLLFVTLIACTCVLVYRGRQFELPLWRHWLVYAAVALFSISYAVDPRYSMGEIRAEVLYPFLMLGVSFAWIRSVPAFLRLAWIVAAGNLLLVLLALYLGVTARPTGIEVIDSIRAGPGTFSTYVVTVLPLVAVLAWRQYAAGRLLRGGALTLLMVGNVAAIYFTENRAGFLALAFGGLSAGFVVSLHTMTWRRALVGVLALALLLALTTVQISRRHSIDSWQGAAAVLRSDPRWEIWSFAIARIAEHPLTGKGFGRESFDLAFPEFKQGRLSLWHAHNALLNKGIQMGLPGMLSFACLLWATGRAFGRGLDSRGQLRPYAVAGIAVLAGVFAKNMTDDFFVRDGALLFWVLAGALMGAIDGSVASQPEKASGRPLGEMERMAARGTPDAAEYAVQQHRGTLR